MKQTVFYVVSLLAIANVVLSDRYELCHQFFNQEIVRFATTFDEKTATCLRPGLLENCFRRGIIPKRPDNCRPISEYTIGVPATINTHRLICVEDPYSAWTSSTDTNYLCKEAHSAIVYLARQLKRNGFNDSTYLSPLCSTAKKIRYLSNFPTLEKREQFWHDSKRFCKGI